MTLRILQTTCLASIAAVLMALIPGVAAGDTIESVPQNAAQLVAKDANWTLLLREDGKVTYKGVVSSDPVGAGTGQVLYPAPNAAGLLAAVITHGIIAESVKSSEKEKQQETANHVLLPYQVILNEYKKGELMQRGLEKASSAISKKLVLSVEKSSGNWLVESAPIFSMTQDQHAIVLDNNISIYAPGASVAAFQYTVRVVSQGRGEGNPADFWTANQGHNLKEESASLFAESLDIAVKEAVGGQHRDIGAFKTVRYQEGGNQKMERAQIVDEYCSRLVLKTLRGWLMSVPKQQNASPSKVPSQCDDSSGISRHGS